MERMKITLSKNALDLIRSLDIEKSLESQTAMTEITRYLSSAKERNIEEIVIGLSEVVGRYIDPAALLNLAEGLLKEFPEIRSYSPSFSSKLAANLLALYVLSKFELAAELSTRKKNVEEILGKNHERRVFVSGNYDDLPTLRLVADRIVAMGYSAIVPFDFKIPKPCEDPQLSLSQMTRLLISASSLAVFIVSGYAGGHFIEFDMAYQMGIPTLVLVSVRKKGDSAQLLSAMMRDFISVSNAKIIEYSSFEELEEALKNYFMGRSCP